MLTWHTPNVPHTPADPERYWSSQRTLYVLSSDLKTFDGPPKLLFDWDIATIDTTLMPGDDGTATQALLRMGGARRDIIDPADYREVAMAIRAQDPIAARTAMHGLIQPMLDRAETVKAG